MTTTRTTNSDYEAAYRRLTEQGSITVPDYQALTGLHRTSAYRAVRDGVIPSFRVGRSIRIPSTAVRAQLGL
ncbi:MAG: helix-turn-helix domain-containing protein [Gordonia sp. (in: high G+C Gram-positive bacteria)]|uniref:helix-turn-helix domain-containing protein n=1 Tax=Gordonia sp. (in: high G+C Gram-positive bacteria) TaxID=84139 RepID=UPI0039E2FAA0